MAEQTQALIGRLVADARPVRRLRPPVVRAGLWLASITIVLVLAVFLFADLGQFLRRESDPKLAIETLFTLLTGIAAVLAAFELSLPDRSPRWIWLPLPPLVVWIATSGYSCYRHWIVLGPNGWGLGESADCFRFIVGFSAPLGASLLFLLQRAAPLAPLPVAATGGLGVAAIAAFALQFFHPFDITFMDLGIHLAAITLVVAIASLSPRFTGRRESPGRRQGL